MTTRIMVIDDEPLICTLLEYQLGGAGYTVTSFQRAHEALVRMTHEQPDLILLDVMMPEISGWDLCRQIRASSNVPVIMLTAKHGDDDVVVGLTNGADDYVGKPFNQAHLIARIEAVLRRSQAGRGRAQGVTPTRNTRPALAPVPAATAGLTPPIAPPLAAAAAPVAQSASSQPGPVAQASQPQPAAPATPRAAPPLPRLGLRLAEARKQRGMSLYDAGQAVGVRWEFLQAIEQEEFNYIPKADLRQALRAYSGLVGVDLGPYASRRRKRSRRPGPLSLTVGMAAFLAVALVVITMAM
jgi:CheY-like chemotaxis protein/DNA-binding XRE family transcriptional regulator